MRGRGNSSHGMPSHHENASCEGNFHGQADFLARGTMIFHGAPCFQDATLAFGRMRIVAVAVRRCNPAISVVDDEFSSLIAANLATAINSFLLSSAVFDCMA